MHSMELCHWHYDEGKVGFELALETFGMATWYFRKENSLITYQTFHNLVIGRRHHDVEQLGRKE